MMKFVLQPPLGYRTYRLHLASLLCGTGLLILGILKGADLMSLGIGIASILGPVTGFSAMAAGKDRPSPTSEPAPTER